MKNIVGRWKKNEEKNRGQTWSNIIYSVEIILLKSSALLKKRKSVCLCELLYRSGVDEWWLSLPRFHENRIESTVNGKVASCVCVCAIMHIMYPLLYYCMCNLIHLFNRWCCEISECVSMYNQTYKHIHVVKRVNHNTRIKQRIL